MAGFSKALAVNIFNATLNGAGRTNLTAIPNLYLALHTAEPGDNSVASSEAGYTGYSRLDASAVFALTTDEVTGNEVTVVAQNQTDVTFGASISTGSVVISHWALWKTAGVGSGAATDLLYSGALLDGAGNATTRTIQEGDIPLFQTGQLKIKLV
jgi:hypothetical protein